MANSDTYDAPMIVTSFEGAVIVEAPEGPAAMALTPKAALESAARRWACVTCRTIGSTLWWRTI